MNTHQTNNGIFRHILGFLGAAKKITFFHEYHHVTGFRMKCLTVSCGFLIGAAGISSAQFVVGTGDLVNGQYRLQYSSETDQYYQNGTQILTGWAGGVASSSNINRYVDPFPRWYLKPATGAGTGTVIWAFDFSSTGLIISDLQVQSASHVFHDGGGAADFVKWYVSTDQVNWVLYNNNTFGITFGTTYDLTSYVTGSDKYYIKAEAYVDSTYTHDAQLSRESPGAGPGFDNMVTLSAPFGADLEIGRTWSNMKGKGIVNNTGRGQKLRLSTTSFRRTPALFRVRLGNTGGIADRFTLRATRTTRRVPLDIKYYLRRKGRLANITAKVVAGIYESPRLAANEMANYRVDVRSTTKPFSKTSASRRRGWQTEDLRFRAISSNDSTARDTVIPRVRYQ